MLTGAALSHEPAHSCLEDMPQSGVERFLQYPDFWCNRTKSLSGRVVTVQVCNTSIKSMPLTQKADSPQAEVTAALSAAGNPNASCTFNAWNQ